MNKLLLEYGTTPAYPNGCSHGGYLFSYTSVDQCGEAGSRRILEERIDVYVFDNGGRKERQEFCLRFGKESGDYYSPGSIRQIIESARLLARYRDLLSLLQDLGYVRWEPNA